MKIKADSKYNIGDVVFVLVEEDRYNDYYRNELIWRVRGNTENNYEERKLVISEIIARQDSKGVKVQYLIDRTLYDEKDVFTDLEQAYAEREIRNERDNYI